MESQSLTIAGLHRENSLTNTTKNICQYLGIRFALGALSIIPLALRRKTIRRTLRFVAGFLKKHRNIAHRNLALALPESTTQEKDELFIESFCAMGDLVLDLERFPKLTQEWADSHIGGPGLDKLRAIKEQDPTINS